MQQTGGKIWGPSPRRPLCGVIEKNVLREDQETSCSRLWAWFPHLETDWSRSRAWSADARPGTVRMPRSQDLARPSWGIRVVRAVLSYR